MFQIFPEWPGLRLALLGAVLAGCCPTSANAQDPKPAEATATLKPGDLGPAVEGLQRRLNARLSPSPELSVDGDFGDATRAALLRFQRSNRLEPTGLADPATLRALGADPGPEPPPPAPEIVNAQPVSKKPADSPDGPPFTNAPAWVIVDGKTSEILWGSSEDKPREMASTTKIMTALVVLRLASTNPSVLDETLTFSERADRTPGSTAGVKAGEKVSVRELLYGLLLPSGNDAAEAFAEYFGARLDPPEEETDAKPTARFVAEMNRVADELGLRETHFANPHGLPAPGHQASPRDLARLAHVAMADPTFAKVVGTTRRGASLVDASGASRNVVWKNTNDLLGFEGYEGVKTGTTTGAGACLVAIGQNGGDRLIVVILGAPTSNARYVDARNLFRWAWRQRRQK
ncbi:peptidoglycan-binding protein [Tundrisphaera lichenicola]|uniref:peptidoglycan-binding protein n=1 Tax=Tundrisphaera lichenicola TaxID=2029860 RepID=UPI003EB9D3A3